MRIFVGRERGGVLVSVPMQHENQTNIKASRSPMNEILPKTKRDPAAPACGFGRELMPYHAVMERMAETPVNSVQTSSLPFAQLMRPSKDLDLLLDYVETICDVDGAAPEPFERFLEYPVWPRDPATGKAIGAPSMSDAMLLGAHVRIAVEAKWTEPHYGPYQTVGEWLEDPSRDGGSVTRKKAVLKSWTDEVRSARALRRGVSAESLAEIPYQLLHRTASACHHAGPKHAKKPILCYVVFRDPTAPQADAVATASFEDSILGRWTSWLDLAAIEVLLVRVPIIGYPEPMPAPQAARLFIDIGKGLSPYRFDWDGITMRRGADRRAFES